MSSFPAMISNEPPPIDSSDEAEEDFDDEFRSNSLRLDISADPSPLCSPRKPPLGYSNHNHKPSPLTVPNQNQQSEITPSLINGDSIAPEEETLNCNKVNLSEDEYLNVVNTQYAVETIHSQITSNITSTYVASELTNGNEEEDISLQDECVIPPPPCDQPLQEANSVESHQVLAGEEKNMQCGQISEAAQLHVSFRENGVQHSSEAKTEDGEEPLQGILQDFTSVDSITENIESSLETPATEVQMEAAVAAEFEPTRSSNNFGVSPEADALEDEDSFGEFDAAPASSVFNNGEHVQKSKSLEAVEIPDLFPVASVDTRSYSNCQGSSNAHAIGIDEPEDFGDFSSNFNSEPSVVVPPSPASTFASSSSASTKPVEEHLSRAHFPTPVKPEEEDDDDFGDFASSGAKDLAIPTISSQLHTATPLVHPPPTITTPPTLMRRDSLQSEGRLDALVKSVFAHPPLCLPNEGNWTPLEPIDKQLGNSASNAAWTHIQEFEDSHCLLYKWPRSGVYHLLMKSLNIDASNVIYSAKYGTIQVPKFASSLVDTPLQPQTVNSTPFDYPVIDDGMPIERLDDDSPDDPVMVDPKLACDPKLNKEAVRILEQLPDLSYMLAKTLIFPRHPNY